MRHETNRPPPFAPDAFAHLGEGHVAYLREMSGEDLAALVPEAPPVPPGLRLWALIGAAGTPILIADDRDAAIAGAAENDLTMVAVH